jgi:hypothetical protein
VTACPRCGTALSPKPPGWARNQHADKEPDEADYQYVRFISVYEIKSRADIPLIHSLLAAAGIRYVIRNENAVYMMTAHTVADVRVDPERVEEARSILEQLERDPDA